MAERSQEREIRSTFFDEIKKLVQTISEIPGISGCIACHDGLLVAQAGNLSDFEAVAAVAQECVSTASKSTSPLDLGALRQVSVIGDQAKLALITMGEITVGIVCPVETVLSRVLSDPAR
jgi:predicted regulator of Ras-like GTPase activity (Roadblock/LC7/MglB family)